MTMAFEPVHLDFPRVAPLKAAVLGGPVPIGQAIALEKNAFGVKTPRQGLEQRLSLGCQAGM
jgi:hypothetical protein